MQRAFGCTAGVVSSKPSTARLAKSFRAGTLAALSCWAVLALSQPVKAQPPFSLDDIRSALAGSAQSSAVQKTSFHNGLYQGDATSALRDFVDAVSGQTSDPNRVESSSGSDESYSALRDFVTQISAEAVESPHGAHASMPDETYSALLDFAQKVGAAEPGFILAQAQVKPKVVAKPAKAVAVAGEATYVGKQVCLGCHATQAASFAQTLMGKVGQVTPGKMDCENCHGPGSAHAKAGGGRGVGGIVSFRPDDRSRTAEEHNAVCLNCHNKGDRTLWEGSTHQTRDVACTNCHTIMQKVSRKSQLKTVAEQDTCFQCHKEKRAEISRYAHMPVREGKMTCTNCHNPHGTYGESLLKEATINDVCYKCHAEKRGPFLFEHAPVRESCVNCHDPHGSTNEFMLKVSRPRLCQQCHATAGGHPGNPRNPFSVFAINRECQNCHNQIHGSNSPSGPRFHR